VLLYAGALYAGEWLAPELVLRGVWAGCAAVAGAALVGWILGAAATASSGRSRTRTASGSSP